SCSLVGSEMCIRDRHYLGRILKLLSDIASSHRSQALLTSHSPAILRRIDPASVRHLRLDPNTHQTVASRITLPKESDEAHKYIRQAVKAYPELYFARLVVLCEGDSEELILPKLCDLADVPVDPSFISVVPLGGRHVNHFWRLLNESSIPYVTLLDLDRERETGGWARIKYVIDQLLLIGKSKRELLKVIDDNAKTRVMSDETFAGMHEWDETNCGLLRGWLDRLETYNVFFSYPLDIDFSMLQRFPNAYHLAKSGRGPRIPDQQKDADGFQKRLRSACQAVLKSEQSKGTSYTSDQMEAFIWYQHLFLGRGKPSTHILALNEIKPTDLWEKAPKPLKRLIGRIQGMLK
ncbi:MAG: ATP-dependent endonuclease, partial [Armatimonadetes bacterium Cent15-Ar3]